MKSVIVKLLLTVSISAMVVFAALGGYYVFELSQDPSIVAPVQDNFQTLPSQSPRRQQQPQKQYFRPGFYNEDAPGAK